MIAGHGPVYPANTHARKCRRSDGWECVPQWKEHRSEYQLHRHGKGLPWLIISYKASAVLCDPPILAVIAVERLFRVRNAARPFRGGQRDGRWLSFSCGNTQNK
eukprot:scaffold299769_cov37-Attheya_sp.AAC.1